MISSSQRLLPDNTQHSQQTNIHAPGGIRNQDRIRRAAVDLRLRPRGYWDRRVSILHSDNCCRSVFPFCKHCHLTKQFPVPLTFPHSALTEETNSFTCCDVASCVHIQCQGVYTTSPPRPPFHQLHTQLLKTGVCDCILYRYASLNDGDTL